MSQISNLFDSRSKKYNQIYSGSHYKNLLHQEKSVRARLVEKLVANYISLDDKDVIVDVGCGMGNVLLNIKERGVNVKMHGVDISQGMIALANERLDVFGYTNIDFNVGSAKDIIVKANIVLSLGVLGYQKNQESFLTELSNLVDNNGSLIFTTANGDSFLRWARRYLSKLHSLIKGKTKSKGVEFFSIKNKQVESVLIKSGFKLNKRIYITFGLGLFASSIECSIDRLFVKYFSNSFVGKYLSLTVIYVYKRID